MDCTGNFTPAKRGIGSRSMVDYHLVVQVSSLVISEDLINRSSNTTMEIFILYNQRVILEAIEFMQISM